MNFRAKNTTCPSMNFYCQKWPKSSFNKYFFREFKKKFPANIFSSLDFFDILATVKKVEKMMCQQKFPFSFIMKWRNQAVTVFENHRKVSFNIASEASYVYNLSGKKLIKNAKNGPFWRVFENLKLAVKQCYQRGQF